MSEAEVVSEQSDPTAEAVLALRALVLAAHGFRQELANALDVTVSDTLALSHLALAGTLSAGELARRSGLAPSSVTAMLDRLERAGLARRAVRPGNRRAHDVTLTERGAGAVALSARWASAAFGAIPAGDLPRMAGGLRSLAGALRAEADAFGAVASAADLDELLASRG
ncbi:MAG TPA: MarR family transcriptional regulator [Jatrophihabitans sp.]|nr:MarR family transcriptional regulator [Jatrophihabitans sp.]